MMRYLLSFWIVAITLFSGCLLSGFSYAEVTMNFRGTLIETPPCLINQGNALDVSFSEIGVRKIDGINNQQTLAIPISCEGSQPELVLRYLGIETDFDTSAVQTTISDFGIRLLRPQDSGGLVPFTLGSTMSLGKMSGDNNTTLTFSAVPVKRPGSELSEGAFEAIATLQLEYQ